MSATGAAYSNGRIYFNTVDGNAIAVEASTGKEVWRTKLGDINRGETVTMAPLVVKDKVLIGNWAEGIWSPGLDRGVECGKWETSLESLFTFRMPDCSSPGMSDRPSGA
jgi:outer membrane protein assembly factor BamB